MRLLTTKHHVGDTVVTGMSTAMTGTGKTAAMTETGMIGIMQMAGIRQMADINSMEGTHLYCLLVTARTLGILQNLNVTDLDTLKMPGMDSLTVQSTTAGNGMTIVALVHLEDGIGLVVLLNCDSCSGFQGLAVCTGNDYAAGLLSDSLIIVAQTCVQGWRSNVFLQCSADNYLSHLLVH